jgi:hypothetical protein
MAKRNLNTKTKTGAKSPAAASKPAAQIASTKNDAAQLLKKNRKAAAPVLLANGLNGNSASSTLQRKPEPVPEVQGEAKPSTYIDRGLPLPENYGLDRLVALVRDPRWIYSYWELQGSLMPSLRDRRGQSFIDSCAWVLRLHRIHENIAVDIEIDPSSGCWYLNVGGPGTYQLELGLLSPDGEWISLLASYVVKTPRTSPSDVIDEEWGVMPGEDESALLQSALGLADAAERGTSGFLGSSRLQSSFALASSLMLGSSASGRPVAGSWAFSFLGASRVSGSGSGGFGWMTAPNGAHEPMLDRPLHEGGPNWNAQLNLPVKNGKAHQAHFTVKLPRTLSGIALPTPTWPPADVARSAPTNPRKLKALKIEKSRS